MEDLQNCETLLSSFAFVHGRCHFLRWWQLCGPLCMAVVISCGGGSSASAMKQSDEAEDATKHEGINPSFHSLNYVHT
jgi:hypothetical protein